MIRPFAHAFAAATVACLASCAAPSPSAPRLAPSAAAEPNGGATEAAVPSAPAADTPQAEAAAITASAPEITAVEPSAAQAAPESPEPSASELPRISPPAPRDPPEPARAPALAAGGTAPDFTLADTLGANPVSLRALRGKPAVLIFGSCSCPPFVRSTRATGALYQRFRGRVNFLMVYGREAHPTDGWAIEGNRFEVKQATTIDERRAAARAFAQELRIEMPLVVDTIEGDAERLYDPFPNRLVVIDAEGRIAHIGARGPQSTLNSAREVPAILDGLLKGR